MVNDRPSQSGRGQSAYHVGWWRTADVVKHFASMTVALLEPGASGMAAPPELVAAASTEAPSTEPSPLAALHDISRDHARGDDPGGLTCRIAMPGSGMPR